MKPWMKVVIGCFAVAVIGLFLLVAGLVGFGYWAKNKVEEVTGGGSAVEEARRTANAVPFTRPEGGVVAESRLVKFIEVRASLFSVYEKYRGEIESRVAKVKEGKSFDLGDISTGLTVMGELRRAEMLALAKQGMSEDEYAFITGEVSKAMWTEFGGEAAAKKAIVDANKAAVEAMKAAEAGMPPEAREAMAKAGSEIEATSKQAASDVESAATAPANVALFKKYEADLKKYAMPGLHFIVDGEAASTPTPGKKPQS